MQNKSDGFLQDTKELAHFYWLFGTKYVEIA